MHSPARNPSLTLCQELMESGRPPEMAAADPVPVVLAPALGVPGDPGAQSLAIFPFWPSTPLPLKLECSQEPSFSILLTSGTRVSALPSRVVCRLRVPPAHIPFQVRTGNKLSTCQTDSRVLLPNLFLPLSSQVHTIHAVKAHLTLGASSVLNRLLLTTPISPSGPSSFHCLSAFCVPTPQQPLKGLPAPEIQFSTC